MQEAISNKLVALFTAARDGDDNPIFGSVIDYDNGEAKFDTWPVCMVLPSDQPADVSTNKENERREGFTAYLMIPIGNTVEERQASYAQMRTTSDQVRNIVDATIDLDGLRANGGLDRVMGVVPASAGWDIIDSSAGATLLVKVEIVARYSHRTN